MNADAIGRGAWLATGAVMIITGGAGAALQVSTLALPGPRPSGRRLAAACVWLGVAAALLVLGVLACARVVFG